MKTWTQRKKRKKVDKRKRRIKRGRRVCDKQCVFVEAEASRWEDGVPWFSVEDVGSQTMGKRAKTRCFAEVFGKQKRWEGVRNLGFGGSQWKPYGGKVRETGCFLGVIERQRRTHWFFSGCHGCQRKTNVFYAGFQRHLRRRRVSRTSASSAFHGLPRNLR